MNEENWFAGTLVVFATFIVWWLAYEAMCWWQRRRTWKRFNRDEQRVVLLEQRKRP